MIRSRSVYLIWLMAVGLLHIFGNEYGTRVIFVASLVVPAVLIALTWVSSRRLYACLDCPSHCECGEAVSVRVIVKGNGLLAGYIKCSILCENLLTGEQFEEKSIEFSINTLHCGMMLYSVKQLAAVDMFGLFEWKTNCELNGNMLIKPKQYEVQYEINDSENKVIDSDVYSTQQPGNDPAETFAIREYSPGDLLKSIHWKLSQKTDRLLVREMGLSVGNNVVLLMETSISGEGIEPAQISALAAAVYNLSRGFVVRDIKHAIGWLNTALLMYENYEIDSYNELETAFEKLLANTVKACETTAVEVYGKATAEIGLAYVPPIIITHENYNG